jgi:hypothetical protein
MRSVKIDCKKLLDIVKKNRENHRKTFLEALDGYREAVVAELEKMLDEAKRGRRIRRGIELVEPMDQTKDYDRVIKMLEMSEDQVVELTSQEFAQYVQDDWHWKQQFDHSTVNYLKHKLE